MGTRVGHDDAVTNTVTSRPKSGKHCVYGYRMTMKRGGGGALSKWLRDLWVEGSTSTS